MLLILKLKFIKIYQWNHNKEENSSCVILYYMSSIINNITGNKMLRIIDKSKLNSSFLKSLSECKICQLENFKLVSQVISASFDSLSNGFLRQADSLANGAFREENTVIVFWHQQQRTIWK